ncbi:glycosyl hydrolase family 28-related protein [Macrococcus sp. EM39E]|uniref:glycosyl hydrolase family 28-related protein n=1 Tax=Macrococcus animalis TaxID=3395467 RepID=UPI0039BF95C0
MLLNKKWLLPTVALTLMLTACQDTQKDKPKETDKDKTTTEEVTKEKDKEKITEGPSLKGIKSINVKDFGAKPDDKKDDTEALTKAIQKAQEEAVQVIIPKGTYDTNKTIEVSNIKGLHIKGEGAVIKPKNPMTNPPEFYAMRLGSEKNFLSEIEIEGITIDGSKNPQDLYFKMKDADDFYKTPMTKGIAINNTNDLNIHDVEFKHMYGGYAIFAQEYRDVNIKDVNLEDVGGDDITDSFGMAIYLSGHRDDAIVNIDKVVSNAKTSKRSKEYMGWIGVVLENGTIQDAKEENWLKDQNTTINVTNSTFNDYETTFHVESTYGNVYWNTDDVKTRAKSYFIAAGVNGELRERSNNVEMDLLPFGRNDIVHGVYYTEGMKPENYSFNMHNSVVNNVEMDGKRSPITAVYANNTTATFHNTTFNDVSKRLVANGTGTFIDSVVNLTKDAKKDALGEFSEKTQKIDLSKSTVNEAGTKTEAKAGKVPDKLKSTNKPIPKRENPLAPADLGRQVAPLKAEDKK